MLIVKHLRRESKKQPQMIGYAVSTLDANLRVDVHVRSVGGGEVFGARYFAKKMPYGA